MIWLSLAIILLLAVASAFGASFLSSGWKRRKRTEQSTLRIDSILPGYDCGLCGAADCRAYAAAVDGECADPARCAPGGSRVEARLRSSLEERTGDLRSLERRAVVRCGGTRGVAVEEFPYDGRQSCASAVGRYGGPKRCKEGCVGFGSCVRVCELGAIRVVSGVAHVNPALCTGCGVCLSSCPTGVLSLIPRDQAWYVACASAREPETREADCSAACTACGECASRSVRGEFSLVRGRARDGGSVIARDGGSVIARENPDARSGRWQDIAEACPTRAIVQAGEEKRRRSPSPPK